jgi:hypothetical protein
VAKLRRRLRIIEVADVLGVIFGVASFEQLYGLRQGQIGSPRITEPGVSAGLHGEDVSGHGRRVASSRTGECGLGELSGFLIFAEKSRLMAHRVETTSCKLPVIPGFRKPKSLDEITLRQAVLACIVGHPSGEVRRLGYRVEALRRPLPRW